MKYIRLTAFIAVTLIAVACDSVSRSEKSMEAQVPPSQSEIGVADFRNEEGEYQEEGFYPDTLARPQTPGGNHKQQKQTAPQPDWDKKIIKTALLNVEVKDYNKFYSSIREKVKGLGGYIAQEEQTQTDYKIENSVIIKIPVDQFDNGVVQVTSNTHKINEKKISSQDVTTEMVDTKSRIEAKKQVRQRYMDLLKQAKNMTEILSVETEINEIQVQIEAAAGRVEYLGHSSAFSTIHLTFYQVLNELASDNDTPSFGTKLSNAFAIGWTWIGDLFVGLVSIWPLFLLIFFGVIIYRRSRAQKPKQA